MNTIDLQHLRRFGLPILMVTAALGLSACGDDEESSSGSTEEASAEEVTVTATEYEFELSATPSADTKSVTFQNDGKEFHVMIFAKINEGFTVEEAIKLQGEKGSAEDIAQLEGQPGKPATAEIKGPLEPGSYAILCPIGGPEGPHYELGQLEEFDIE